MKHRNSSTTRPARLRAALLPLLLCPLFATGGCIFSDEESIGEGIVRSEQADVYSSTALVALKVTTVKRGDTVEILRREPVTGPTYTEDWLQIRLTSDAETSGWIEARHVVSKAVVDETSALAGTPEELPAIGRGRLKVNQRLRLAPGRDSQTAVVLSRGTEFDIIGKEQTTYKPERKPKPGEESEGGEPAAADAEIEPEARVDDWYRVRLDEGSIIHGGWILAQSVSLQVPDEILHLEGDGRRFVAWQTVGTVVDPVLAERDPERAKRSHYVTFMRRGNVAEGVDFERIYCLFWDVNTHNYYAPYVDSDLRGAFPITQRVEGQRTIVTTYVLNAQNEKTKIEIEVVPGEKGRTTVRRVTPPVPGERLSRRR